MMRRWLFGLVIALGTISPAWAAETMPPAPTEYVTDYAHVISPAVVANLNQELEQFERQTSNQVVVAVFPKMESDSSLEDYTHRMLESWKVGQKDKNNGVGLFVFIADHRARIEVNYGLEGALPDALAKRILDDEITPHFRNNDYDGGLTAGVTAIEQAIRGEYKGNGSTVANQVLHSVGSAGDAVAGALGDILLVFFFLLFAYLRFRSYGGATVYGSSGRSFATGMLLGGMSGGFGGGGFGGGGGGGFSGGGGGGFSGGGGSGGGGGASGSW
jgi:uncharacterized protein